MIRTKDKIIYAFGNFSNGIILQALTFYLVFFGTSILGISGTVVGLMVSISVGWDAISDPFVGHWSDFTSNERFGRRHLFMIVGATGLAFFNGVLWSIDAEWPYLLKAVMLFMSIILVKTFMTVFVTPYNALGGELSEDYHERTSIQAYRTVLFNVGLAFTTVAGMLFYFKSTDAYPTGQLNPEAYRNLGITISVLILMCSGMAIFGTSKYIKTLPQNKKAKQIKWFKPMVEEFKGLFRNRNYLDVAGAYLSANMATAVLGAIGMHVFTFTFGMDNTGIAVMFGAIFLVSVISQVYWINVVKKRDKKGAALLAVYYSLVGGGLFAILLLFRDLVANNYFLLLIYGIPTGVGLGGLITLPFSMIADTVDEEELETGHRSEGLYYGGLTFSYKISQSAAILVVGVILDLLKFDSTLEVQEASTAIGLGIVIVVSSILALLGALYFYQRYSLSKERVEEIKMEIQRNKEPQDESA